VRLVSQRTAPNCWLDAPGWGRVGLVVTSLGYGMNIVTKDGSSRTKRTIYPYVRTSGTWYVQAEFASRDERDTVNTWILYYISRISNPRLTPLPPISVSVPSKDFHKVGYPVSTIEFGDAQGVGRFQTVIAMKSASDPDTSSSKASRFIPASDSLFFNPGGVQLGASPSIAAVPSPPPPTTSSRPYSGPI
jgi:hypothetical protein